MKQHCAGNLGLALAMLAVTVACDGTEPPSNPGTGGAPVAGAPSQIGGATSSGGITPATGGRSSGGQSSAGTGGRASGGTSTGGNSTGGSTAQRPCDIYQSGNTPCVAAHSTVRALYGAFSGNLYQVRRASDKATRDIAVLTPGGYANSATQDTFCSGTTCTISVIYDQSPQGNHLTRTTGGWIGDRAKEANATALKVTVGGHAVYGIHVPQSDGLTGVGYRNNAATGTARNDEPESMYMVANGKYYNDQCCFDYGNAETNSLNNGNGTMEAIYFGNCTAWGKGAGSGPWVMADLENGLFGGQTFAANPTNTSLTYDYVTTMLKGKPGGFALKGGDARSGTLKTLYEGGRPANGYDPMKKEGAIVLGTGGDNSFMGVGDFFEGAMTKGYASDATDNAVQANIVGAGYGG